MISAAIAYREPYIFNIFSFIGGSYSTLLAITFPYLCYYKLGGPACYRRLMVCIVFTLTGFTAATISLLDLLGILDLNLN